MNAPGYGLTARQRELLAYIAERDLCPSYEEMRSALKLASASGVYGLIRQLEERGYIRRLPNRARAIEVIRAAAPPPVNVACAVSTSAGPRGPRIVFLPLHGRID